MSSAVEVSALRALVVFLSCVVLSGFPAAAQCHVFTNCVDCALIRECGWCDRSGTCMLANLVFKDNGTFNGCPRDPGAVMDPWTYKSYGCNCSHFATCGECAAHGCGMCNSGVCVTPYSDGRAVNCSSDNYAVCSVNPSRAVECGCAVFSLTLILFICVSVFKFRSLCRHIPCNKVFLVTVGLELLASIGRILRFVCERTNLLDGANPAANVRRPLEMTYLFTTLCGQAALGLMYLSIAVNFRYGIEKAELVRYIGVPLLLLGAVPAFVPLLVDRNYYDVVSDEVLFGVTLTLPAVIGLLSILYVLRGIWYMRKVKIAETRLILSRLSYAAVLVVYQIILLVILTNRGSGEELAVQVALVGASLVGALEMVIFIFIENILGRWRIHLAGLPPERVRQLQAEIETQMRGGTYQRLAMDSPGGPEDAEDRLAAAIAAEERDPVIQTKSIADILAELGSAGLPRFVPYERKPSRSGVAAGAGIMNGDW